MKAILRKSDAGINALQVREGEHKLPVRKRTLLLQVDGIKSADELRALAISLGSKAELLDELFDQGLIEIIAEANQSTALAESVPVVTDKLPAIAMDPEPATEAIDDTVADLPVSNKLPEPLQAVALEMRKIVETHFGFKGLLLRRRISTSDTEIELRQALVALTDALTKAKGTDETLAILHGVTTQLPILGLSRAKTYR